VALRYFDWDDLMNHATPGTAPPVTAPEGEFASVDAGAVDAQDLLVLARIAGLPIGEARAAGLARELSNTRAVVAELDRLLRDRPSLALDAFAPFDPAWPPVPPAPPLPAAPDSAGTLDPAR
jgi:hypothetical protein